MDPRKAPPGTICWTPAPPVPDRSILTPGCPASTPPDPGLLKGPCPPLWTPPVPTEAERWRPGLRLRGPGEKRPAGMPAGPAPSVGRAAAGGAIRVRLQVAHAGGGAPRPSPRRRPPALPRTAPRPLVPGSCRPVLRASLGPSRRKMRDGHLDGSGNTISQVARIDKHHLTHNRTRFPAPFPRWASRLFFCDLSLVSGTEGGLPATSFAGAFAPEQVLPGGKSGAKKESGPGTDEESSSATVT